MKIDEDKIRAMEAREAQNYSNMIENQVKTAEEKWDRMTLWLEEFNKHLSPRFACKMTDISMNTYRKWRGSDSRFCRAMNMMIDEHRDELFASAVASAKGYTKEDDAGNLVCDSEGVPIRYDSQPKVALEILGLTATQRNADIKEEQLNLGKTGKNVVINIGNQTSALQSVTAEQFRGLLLEAEVEQDEE